MSKNNHLVYIYKMKDGSFKVGNPEERKKSNNEILHIARLEKYDSKEEASKRKREIRKMPQRKIKEILK